MEFNEILKMNLDPFFFSSQEFMVIAGKNGKFLKINPALIEASGYSESELTSVSFLEFIHADDLPMARVEAEKAMSGETIPSFEARFLCKNGKSLWVCWNCITLNGMLYASGRDISAYKRTMSDLIDSENRMRMILSNSPMALSIRSDIVFL